MKEKISITAIGSLSTLGKDSNTIWNEYQREHHCFTIQKFNKKEEFVSKLGSSLNEDIDKLKNSSHKYKHLDRSVLMAILAARIAIDKAEWNIEQDDFGINIGSSRGATELFEMHHKNFIENGSTHTLTSPNTTLGNISSWVAHDLKCNGIAISHSITCSTSLHAVLNGIAWLQSGLADKFLVGGSEAPLTDFTLAQMNALKIYSKEHTTTYPCQSLNLKKKSNTMILGEASCIACLENGYKENALGYIIGIGYATDDLTHNTSISDEATCFQKSMRMALKNISLNEVDVIVMHAPGTIKGDMAEYKAIEKVFGLSLPLLTSNKWKIGHTFGTSGILSIEFALMMMEKNQFINTPTSTINQSSIGKKISKILVNAVGFGGNAVSILLSKD